MQPRGDMHRRCCMHYNLKHYKLTSYKCYKMKCIPLQEPINNSLLADLTSTLKNQTIYLCNSYCIFKCPLELEINRRFYIQRIYSNWPAAPLKERITFRRFYPIDLCICVANLQMFIHQLNRVMKAQNGHVICLKDAVCLVQFVNAFPLFINALLHL